MSPLSHFKKFSLGTLIVLFLFTSVAGSFFNPTPAEAAWPTTILGDVPGMAARIADSVKENWKTAILIAAQRAISYFMRKVAYDTAVYLASGGKGQSPFARTKGFEDYIGGVASEAFGEAIYNLGKPFGLNLCKIPDVKVDLAFRLGLKRRYDEGGPAQEARNCNFQQFVKNWSGDAWKSKYGTAAGLQNQFNVSLSPTDNDLGIYWESVSKIDNLVQRKSDAVKQEDLVGKGFLPATRLISGDIKTPAAVMEEEMKKQSPNNTKEQNQAVVNSAISSGYAAIIPSTLSMFLNTFANTALKNFKEKGMLPLQGFFESSSGGSGLAKYESIAVGGRQAAEALFADILSAPVHSKSDYDILALFADCPEEPGPNNCVLSDSLAAAVRQATYDEPITIDDAIKSGVLNGGFKLISPVNKTMNADKNCFGTAYCYNNIKKMRLAGILPLGFEIAAERSNPDNPWSLKEVKDGFNSCHYGPGGVVIPDPVNFPYCHLIDPNWILRVDSMRCNAIVYGDQTISKELGQRAEECVDAQSCVGYGEGEKNCYAYGYCTKSKNTWNFDATSCEAQNATCREFIGANGAPVSYLYRTLDTASCNADSVGCTAYSLYQVNGVWQTVAKSIPLIADNTGINFNNKVSTACGSNSAGCTAFKIASNNQPPVNLRKAPDYLDCYDKNLSTKEIDWPTNASDLIKVAANAKPECKNYASVCTAEEVNCDLYTNQFTGEKIPGRFTPTSVSGTVYTWNDQCDQSCVGYEGYRELPNNYSKGQPLTYIIPPNEINQNTASTCDSEEVGCSSFTNMSEIVGGGEKVEYYSSLRACIKPDTTKQKNYFTYEGTSSGYQLQSFVLEEDKTGTSDPVSGRIGGPKYVYKDAAELDYLKDTCNEAAYKNKTASLSCRQFNDDKGAIYYRLLDKTIVVNENCTPYRLNSPELASNPGEAPVCFQNGEYRNGFCYYSGLPGGVQTTAGASKVCRVTSAGCSLYRGNAGNNVKDIIPEDGFENSSSTLALAGWNNSGGVVALSLESTHAGEHSLGFAGNNGDLLYKILALSPGETYNLSFWAKGTGINVITKFTNGAITDIGIISLGDTWQYFKFSGVVLQGTALSTNLAFQLSGNGKIFLDNIRLTQVAKDLPLVKSSLNVGGACDSNLNDNLPGEALGCSAYKNTKDEWIYLTNFSYLCREGAIGCTALIDTFNTPEATSRLYNIWLRATNPNGGVKLSIIFNSKEYFCDVPVGSTGCYVDVFGASYEGAVTGSSGPLIRENGIQGTNRPISSDSVYFIPADTTSTSPIYLVADQASSCVDADLGCTLAGLQTKTTNGYEFVTTTIKNDPNLYRSVQGAVATGIMCQSESVGCGAYSSAGGEYYFKDPVASGQKICDYKTNVSIGGSNMSGWFWRDVGVCANTLGAANTKCKVASDCTVGSTTSTCINTGTQACYPNYIQNGGIFGLWSYGNTTTYQNFVGACAREQSGCTEYLDHNDSDKAYYFLNNGQLSKNEKCNGKISEKDGCILLDQTDQPFKQWDTVASYLASAAARYTLIDPNNVGTNKDANLIVQVKKDRSCGEWLACKTSQLVTDPATGGKKEICIELGLCDEAQPSDQLINQCKHWVNNTTPNNFLDFSEYITRGVSFKDKDFTGFSLFNSYQVGDLKAGDCRNNGVISLGVATSSFGVCNTVKGEDVQDSAVSLIKSSCRGYPDQAAPFNSNDPKANLIGSTKCETGEDCDCSYTQAVYGANTGDTVDKYFGLGKVLGADGICQGGFDIGSGNKDGKTCQTDYDCRDERSLPSTNGYANTQDGTCLLPKKQSTKRLIGWEGYCLDYNNLTNHCDLWYPLDTPVGVNSRYNLNASAGYLPPEGSGKYWCVEAKGNANRSSSISDVSSSQYKFTTREWLAFPLTEQWNGGNSINKIPELDFVLNSEELNIDFSEIAAIGLEPSFDFSAVSNITGQKLNEYPNSELLMFVDQKLSGVMNGGNDSSGDGDGYYWSGPAHILNSGDMALDFAWHEGASGMEEINYETVSAVRCNSISVSNKSNEIAFRIIFDRNSGKIKKMTSKICDGGSGSGGLAVKLNFYLKEVCNEIREVVANDPNKPFDIVSKPRTDRLWQNSAFKVYSGTGRVLDLPFNQFSAPFGSFNQGNSPLTLTTKEYLFSKLSLSDKEQAWRKIGYWPIWMNLGGGTPLNCDPDSNGDCGEAALCEDGPYKNAVCDPNLNDSVKIWSGTDVTTISGNPMCNATVENGKCLPSGVITGGSEFCVGLTDGDNFVQDIEPKIDCTGHSAENNSGQDSYCYALLGTGNAGPCSAINIDGKSTKVCIGLYNADETKGFVWRCNKDDDCKTHNSEVGCVSPIFSCQGGFNSGKICFDDSECEGGNKDYYCRASNQIRGMCVGGLNHGGLCGSANDCPSKTYQNTAGGQTVEKGLCVGSSLDTNTVVPPSVPQSGDSAGNRRLSELFVKSFGDWIWDNTNNQYKVNSSVNQEKDLAKGSSVSNFTVTPKPPRIWAVIHDKNDTNKVSASTANNTFSINTKTGNVNISNGVAIMEFYAAADHDQMPLSRIMIDWGEPGSTPYQTTGWFKNHKPKCGLATNTASPSPGLPTANATGGTANTYTGTRVRFGDSIGACEEGYFSFTHYYVCDKNMRACTGASDTNCYDTTTKICRFKPRVQVLDNWGWCSGSCDIALGECYQDGTDIGDGCKATGTKGWVNYGGNILVAPISQ